MSEELNHPDVPSSGELARSSKTSSKSKVSRGDGDGRDDVVLGDRAPQANLRLSEDELVARYRNSSAGSVLPDLSQMLENNPKFIDKHLIWLTTSNPRDPIHARLRLGYELVSIADAPEMGGFINGLDDSSNKFIGYVTINEMIAASISMSLYERYMHEAHNQLPHEEAQKITSAIDQLHEDASRRGGSISEGDGFSELRRSPGRVKFS